MQILSHVQYVLTRVLKGAFSVLVQFTTNCHSIENQTTDLKDSFRESLQFVTLFQ